jgi:hypothetical protein
VTANPNAPAPGQFVGMLAGQNAGLISNVTVTNSTVNGMPNNTALNGVIAGGLVGQNGIFNKDGVTRGTILASNAMVNVTVGNSTDGNQTNYAGGLVGFNPGSINGSFASGTVSGGFTSFAGGLVGQNDFGGSITNSGASGAVSGATGKDSPFGSDVGGLVGFNQGLVSNSFATGAVSGTTETTSQRFAVIVGGLVGLNNGQVTNSYASGNVTANGSIEIGGLVGGNFGPITGSYATGAVNGSGRGSIGGLVGLNNFASFIEGPTLIGSITSSYATGSVTGTGSVTIGGLVGSNELGTSITNSYATGAVIATTTPGEDITVGGLVGDNGGRIASSYATGSVTSAGGDASVGGLVGASGNKGVVTDSFASGNITVTGATNAFVGGLIGGNGGSINRSYATGDVVADGNNVLAGGLLGINAGTLTEAFATGRVTSNSANAILGGLAALNADRGTFTFAYATGAVSGGPNSVIGGLIGVNTGTLEQTYAIGRLTGGGIVGGLVGANNSGPLPPIFGDSNLSLTGTGTATNSYWDTQTTGVSVSAQGNGVPTTGLIASLPPGFDHSVWIIQPDPSYPYFPWQGTATIPITNEPPPNVPSISSQQPQIIDNLINTTQFANLNTTSPLDPGGGVRQPQFPPPQPPPGAGPQQQQPQQIFQRIIDIPPLTETRFVTDQVLAQVRCDTAVPRVEEAVRRLGLSLRATQDLCTTAGSIALQFHITNGQDVRAIIRRLASVQIVAIAQPVYLYEVVQEPAADPAAPASRGNPQQQGGAEQYILQKLQITDVHRIVRGTNVPIAVIDSEIDANHPDLQGVIVQRFSAVGAPEKPHLHGTGMAGDRRKHHVQHPQGHRLGTEPGRAHHQHELRRPEGSLARALAQGRLRQGHRADRRRRQCRAEIAAALSRRRSERDRGDGNRRRRQDFLGRQPRQVRLGGGARRRHPGAGARGRLPADHRHLGRGRRGERRRRATARAQSAAHARRHPAHPHRQRQAAGPRRAQRRLRLRPSRRAQGGAVGRSARGDEPDVAAAVGPSGHGARKARLTP